MNAMLVFAIRDAKIDAFMMPMFFQSKGQALRAISDQVNGGDKENMLVRHPGDFELFYLGSYDQKSGEFACTRPESVCVISELVSPPK